MRQHTTADDALGYLIYQDILEVGVGVCRDLDIRDCQLPANQAAPAPTTKVRFPPIADLEMVRFRATDRPSAFRLEGCDRFRPVADFGGRCSYCRYVMAPQRVGGVAVCSGVSRLLAGTTHGSEAPSEGTLESR